MSYKQEAIEAYLRSLKPNPEDDCDNLQVKQLNLDYFQVPEKRQDRVCGREGCTSMFSPKSARHKYCSRECAAYVPENRFEDRVCQCPGCTNVFEWGTSQPNQKYCSRECSETSTIISSGRNRWILYDRDEYRCNYCGRTPLRDPDIELCPDHIVPRSMGGADTANNLITSCKECNGGKAASSNSITEQLLELVRERNEAAGIPQELFVKFRSDE